MRVSRITQNTPFALRWQWTLLLSDLPANARLVAMMLRLLGDSDGKCIRPSIETVAAATGLSVSSVKRAIGSLLEAGFLTRGRSKGNAPSIFELAIPEGQPDQRDMVSKRPVQFDLVMQEPPVQIEASTRSKQGLSPVHRESGSRIESRREKGRAPASEASPLLARAQASAPAQPKAPTASQARGSAGTTLQPSRTAAIAQSTSSKRDPWSEQSKREARALLQSDLGHRAAREGWIQAAYDFAREHGRLPVDGEECDQVKASGLEFARKIERDSGPLGRAARKRVAELMTAIVTSNAETPAGAQIIAMRPRTSAPIATHWH